jgi:hypothetical protein
MGLRAGLDMGTKREVPHMLGNYSCYQFTDFADLVGAFFSLRLIAFQH